MQLLGVGDSDLRLAGQMELATQGPLGKVVCRWWLFQEEGSTC